MTADVPQAATDAAAPPLWTVTATAGDFGYRVEIAIWEAVDFLCLTPADAREFARRILHVADEAEEAWAGE